MLLALASRAPAITRIAARYDIATFTKAPAGRACSATVEGSRSLSSELVGIPGPLRRLDDLVQREAGRSGHRGGHGALPDRSIGEAHMPVRLGRAHRLDRADAPAHA